MNYLHSMGFCFPSFVASDSGTLQYILLIHHIILFAIHFFRTFVTRKCFNKVLPYCTVRSYHVACWWYYIYSLATASSAESSNTDLPIRRYVDFAARSIKNDSFDSIGAKLPRKVLLRQPQDHHLYLHSCCCARKSKSFGYSEK